MRIRTKVHSVVWLGLVALAALSLPTAARSQAFPPWSHGKNNPAGYQGATFQVDEVDNNPDLHGNPCDAKLVLFIGGNQFMVLPRLVAAFESQHPDLKGKIYYETLPPGILLRQMENQNTITLGNLTLSIKPDVYEAGAKRLDEMTAQNKVHNVAHYATNNLMIMIRKGNPKGIHSLKDLGRENIRLSMPNPEWEGVARLIENSLRKAGGEELVGRVMMDKRRTGTTFLTHIHHRQTAMRIMQGNSDAGVTWQSEVKFQMMIGNPIEGVKIPAEYNTTGVYAAGVLSNAPHPQAAEDWVAFLKTETAQAIYHEYGFGVPSRQ